MSVEIPELLEVRVLQQLGGGPPLIFVVDQHLGDDLLTFGSDVSNTVSEALALFAMGKTDLHVCRMPGEVVEQFLRRSADALVDLVNLVELVLAGEQRTEAEHLIHDAADAPNVHFVGVISVS